MLIAKIIFLFIAVWMTIVNCGRIYNEQETGSGNFLLQAAGITGFITCQWLL